jgi:hypothetical protein
MEEIEHKVLGCSDITELLVSNEHSGSITVRNFLTCLSEVFCSSELLVVSTVT